MKSFLIHRISKPNFLRRFGVPCGRAGKRKKREKRRKNSRKQTFLIFLRFLRNFSYRVKRLFLDSTYPRNFFFSFLFFPFSFDEKHSESKEREKKKIEKAIWLIYLMTSSTATKAESMAPLVFREFDAVFVHFDRIPVRVQRSKASMGRRYSMFHSC